MKKTTVGFAAAALLGLASFASPASAFQAPMPGAAAAASDAFTNVQFRRRPICKIRTVVTRHHGHRVVKKIRTCR